MFQNKNDVFFPKLLTPSTYRRHIEQLKEGHVWGLLLTTPCSHIDEENRSLFLNPHAKSCMWDKNNVIVSKVQ